MSMDDNFGYDSKYLRNGQSRADAFINGIQTADGSRIKYDNEPRSFEEMYELVKALRDRR